MRFFCLHNTLELDAARPVSDMAAFFDYQPAPSAALTLTLAREHGCVSACLQGAEQSFTASEPCSEAAASGEVTRCVKLVVLKVFAELTGLQPKLPWGILTGVRPTKLAHKLLDSGVAAAALPEYLSENLFAANGAGKAAYGYCSEAEAYPQRQYTPYGYRYLYWRAVLSFALQLLLVPGGNCAAGRRISAKLCKYD